MRVISIELDGRVGHPEKPGYAVSWVREMARLVDEYVVIAESHDGVAAGPIALAPNATVHLLTGSPVTYPLRAARLAERLHAKKPFDIATTEDPMRAGLGGALFASRTGVPLNVENHSFHINEPDWLAESFRHRVYNRIGVWVTRHADSIRSYSPGQNRALRAIGIPEARLFVVPACVAPMQAPSREAARARLGIAPDEEIIFSAGRMVPCKNIPVLLEALARLRRERPVRLMLAGDGPSRPQWQALSRTLGLGDAVTWLGQTAESDIPALHAASDVYAASSTQETGPRTVLEAYMAGRPVIVTPDMGVTHLGLCVHDETAFVLDPHDVAAWAAGLETLLEDTALAAQMAALGQARMADNFSMPAIARALLEVFRRTIGRPEPATPEAAGR
jgi:glycosyltransferase involved in cell wall biosynthesis